MKKVLLVLLVLLIGCTTYQPISSVDPIYGYTTKTISNEFELARLLRTDFNFRYDFAQFAMRQPITWQWNNRMFRFGFNRYNRYNYWNPYYSSNGYYNSQNFHQMWNDWLWGMNSSNWWNGWNTNQNNWYNGPYGNMGYNVAYNSSRRNSLITNNRISIKDKIAFGKMGNSRLVTNKPLVNDSNFVIEEDGVRWFSNSKPVINKPVIIKTKPVRNNNKPVYNNNRPVINNNRSNTNSRPIIRNNVKPTRNNVRSTKSNTRSIKNPR